MNKWMTGIGLVLIAQSAWCTNLVVDVDSTHVYHPSSGDSIPIKVYSQVPGIIDVSIYAPDGFKIRDLGSQDLPRNTQQILEWDGKDDQGRPVPNEAYFPRVVLRPIQQGNANVAKEDYHPLLTSGGQIMPKIPVFKGRDSQVVLGLNKPARLLVRAGITDGPLLKTLAAWEPEPSGRLEINWDGKDANHKIDIAELANFQLFATGYELPDSSIIVRGNKENYPEYCGLYRPIPDLRELRKDYLSLNHRLSDIYSDSNCLPTDPVLGLDFSIDKSGKAVATVTLPERYAALVSQDMYEVTFFIDNKFVFEREQGYMPFYWETDVAKLSKNTPHILTANITGFKGHIGTVSPLFEIKK